MTHSCYWYDDSGLGYCCWGIDPASLDSDELWAGPAAYSHGPCPCNGDPRSRDCLCSDKKPWQKTEPYPWDDEEYTARFSVWNFEHESNVLTEYSGGAPQPQLPGRVRKITPWVFADNLAITGLYLPKDLTEIADNAFNGCKNLASITIPPKVETIGDYVFHICHALSRVHFAAADEPLLAQIGANAFCDCAALKEIIIPWGPEKLGEAAFCGCISLEMACLGPGAVSIGRLAFARCPSLRAVYIPESVIAIDDRAFAETDAVVIVGMPGSYAEQWAGEHALPFRQIASD